MQIDVTVLLRDTTREIAAWRCETDRNSQLLTMDEHERHDATEDTWRQLAFAINRLAARDPDVRVDVFLHLRGHLIESLYDISALTEAVNYARDYTWGGNIYIVWDQKPESAFDRVYKGNEKVLEELFRVLMQSGVTDLIEIQKRRKAAGRDEKTVLYECALESKQRRTRLQQLVDSNGWHIVLRDGAYFLADFVGEFVRGRLGLIEGKNLAVFYDQRPPGGWGQLLKGSRLYEQGGRPFVAALSRSNPKDARDLEELWEQESRGLRLFLFNGIFEWLYTFTRLCHASRPAETPVVDASPRDIVWAETARRTASGPETKGRDPRLLVTSAFALRQVGESYFAGLGGDDTREDWERETEHCLAASREIGGFLRHLPFHVAVEVRHRVSCEQMPGFLEGEPFTAWLYLGHGDKELGLREEGTRQYASPQRWLACFEGYEAPLSLVIFAACESAGLARMFVESGVSEVAVGFEYEVLTDATRELSKRVMPAALRSESSLEAVLDAFQEAVLILRRISYAEGGKVMYYSDAEPKAFAARPESP
jgi:hypothetical protein